MINSGMTNYEINLGAQGTSKIGTFEHRGYSANYQLIYNPLNPKIGKSRIRMAWGIAFDFEYTTEEKQFKYSIFTSSGFAVEDISSAYIGFLQAANVLSEKDCETLSPEDSLRMYMYGEGPDKNRSYKPALWKYTGSRTVYRFGGMGEAGYAPPPIPSIDRDTGCDPCANKDKTIPKAFDDYSPKGKNHDWIKL